MNLFKLIFNMSMFSFAIISNRYNLLILKYLFVGIELFVLILNDFLVKYILSYSPNGTNFCSLILIK